MDRASKRVALITGVSGGIGLATAKIFLENGWVVVGTVRSKMRPVAFGGHKIDIQLADMLKSKDLERVVETVWRTYGRLDALICNAGYGLVGPIDSLSYAQMTEQLAVNMLAPAELIRHAVPHMRKQGSGVIVGVSSVVGRTGLAGYSLYSASKFGLEGLFESLSMELAASHIRVKLVEPSGVRTGFWKSLSHGEGAKQGQPQARLYGADRMRFHLSAETVANTILKAATTETLRLRYPLGHTRSLAIARRLLPERALLGIVRRIVTGA